MQEDIKGDFFTAANHLLGLENKKMASPFDSCKDALPKIGLQLI